MSEDQTAVSLYRSKSRNLRRKAPKYRRTEMKGYKDYIQSIGLKISALKSFVDIPESRMYYIFHETARPTNEEINSVREFCIKFGYNDKAEDKA
jgi:hypothetical protein